MQHPGYAFAENRDCAKTSYPTAVAPPPTLASAISGLDELNKFLGALSSRTYQLASMVGGPFPCQGESAASASPEQLTAVSRLNDMVAEAHRRACDIEGAVAAMARSLGS